MNNRNITIIYLRNNRNFAIFAMSNNKIMYEVQ